MSTRMRAHTHVCTVGRYMRCGGPKGVDVACNYCTSGRPLLKVYRYCDGPSSCLRLELYPDACILTSSPPRCPTCTCSKIFNGDYEKYTVPASNGRRRLKSPHNVRSTRPTWQHMSAVPPPLPCAPPPRPLPRSTDILAACSSPRQSASASSRSSRKPSSLPPSTTHLLLTQLESNFPGFTSMGLCESYEF